MNNRSARCRSSPPHHHHQPCPSLWSQKSGQHDFQPVSLTQIHREELTKTRSNRDTQKQTKTKHTKTDILVMMHYWLAQDTCYIPPFLINILVQYSQNLLLLGEKRRRSWGFAALYSLQLLRGAKELNTGGKKPLPLLNPSCCGLFSTKSTFFFYFSSSRFSRSQTSSTKESSSLPPSPLAFWLPWRIAETRCKEGEL